MGTLFSILFAGYLLINPKVEKVIGSFNEVGIAIIAVALFFLVFLSLIFMLSWAPLQRAEATVTPRLLELFKKDRQIKLIEFWFILFFLASVVAAFDLLTTQNLPTIPLIAGWIVGLGISIDLLHHLIKRVFNYMNPFAVADIFIQQGRHSIQNDDTLSYCQTVDALSEVATKAVESSSSSLCTHAIGALEEMEHHFLESTKTVGHEDGEKVEYILYFILQRIEVVFEKGLLMHLEPACTKIITSLGKMTLNAAECDLSLASLPLRTLGKLSTMAESHNWHEVSDKGLCTLVEVANLMSKQLDLSYGDLKEPLLSLNAQMEMITKEMFSQDKTINFELLRQPFEAFKKILQGEKLVSHQDTPIVIQDVDRVLADFATLESILRAVPPIPDEVEEQQT